MVFAIYDERNGHPKYIGKSNGDLRKRLASYKYEAKTDNWNSPLAKWIKDNEEAAEIKLVEDGRDKEWWINYFKFLGCELLNGRQGSNEDADKVCSICGQGFTENQVLGGLFTRHIKSKHELDKREYIIKTEYGGNPPKCACGLCDELPNFARGSFSEYALGHDKHEWRKRKHIEKHGHPTCSYENCDARVKFHRGKPRSYCSSECASNACGGCDEEATKKIKETVKARYGVDNVSKLDEVKRKISEKNKGNRPFSDKTEEQMAVIGEKISKSMEQLWKDPDYRKAVLSGVADSLNDPTKVSKPHKRFRKILNLESRGYKLEKRVGDYIVDELNKDEMKIIEVFGDYVHANPEKFDADDEIVLTGSCYTAKEKWKRDQKKISWLESQGYEVIVLWSSYTEEQAKAKLDT